MFRIKNFSIQALSLISQNNIDEHLKLYAGYVKNANLILEKKEEYKKDSEKYAYELAELTRRFSFEYDGIRNHEVYFSQLEGGASNLNEESSLFKALKKQYGSFDVFLNEFKSVAMTRGVGWSMLYHDSEVSKFIIHFVDEQHLGHLTGLSPILALDMWEHAYVYDFPTSEKKKYVDAFLENLNWNIISNRFKHE